MTRKQYIRNLRGLCLAIHSALEKDGASYKVGKCLRDTKMNVERMKYSGKCYEEMWGELKMARECFGVK